jgi:hypothetical protein
MHSTGGIRRGSILQLIYLYLFISDLFDNVFSCSDYNKYNDMMITEW